jgi:hypothetical protein
MRGDHALHSRTQEIPWSWPYALAIGFLLWEGFVRLTFGDIADSVPVKVVNPFIGWETQVKDFGSLTLVVLIVKWFMKHIEAKDKAFVDMVSSCRAEHARLTEIFMKHLTEGKEKEGEPDV